MFRDGGSYRELPVAPASLREQVLMHTRQAFKRRGNMSYDDSRAGNATNACAQCLNRVRGDMRIVCLITVGAFLLSIAIAESDVPIGASQYQQRPRILLEPVMKSNSEANPINWFINMVQRVIEPPKKSLSPMIGPINLPGLGGHIYIRQREKTIMPWESPNRVVVKLVSRDPVTGNVMPIDSLPFHHRPEESPPYHHRPEDHSPHHHRPEDHQSYHHRQEDHSSYHHRQEDHSSYNHHPADPSRRATKTYGYAPVNHAPSRPTNNIIQQNSYASPQPQYSSWHSQQRPRYQQNHVPHYSKPFRASSPNDFRYDNYGKEVDQGYNKGYHDDYNRGYHDDYNKGYHDDYYHRRPNRMSYHRFTPGVAQPMNAVPLPSMYRSVTHQPSNPDPVYSSNGYNDRFKDSQDIEDQGEGYYVGSGKPDSLRATQVPYPEYPGLADEPLQTIATTKADNVSHVEHTSASPFKSSYREVVRADRMVPAGGHRNHLRNFSRGRKPKSQARGSHRGGRSREFRDGARFDAKFEARDVGGIEVITAPNLQRGWEDWDTEKSREDDSLSSRSRESDSGLNLDEDSISMGNGKNLARGESVEHSNEETGVHDEENFVPVSRKAQSKRSSYKVIDRSHRSQGSHRLSNSTENDDSKEVSAEIIVGRKDHSTEAKSDDQDASVASTEAEETSTMSNVTSEGGQKVVTVTPSNYRRIQRRRKPRVVKAIYRRKPVAGIIKSSAELVESSASSEEKSSQESSSSEN